MDRIVICSTCETGDGVRDGSGFAERLRMALGAGTFVQEHPCLSMCAQPLSLAFSAPGKATYLFAGIDPARDLDDTLAFAALYAAQPDGWIEDARGAGRLRFCLVGRVPA